MQGLQRIAQKIHASEADGSVEKLTTRQRNKERVKMVLKKLVHLMNSLQVKSGSELVFPMLFDHMSFATHRFEGGVCQNSISLARPFQR